VAGFDHDHYETPLKIGSTDETQNGECGHQETGTDEHVLFLFPPFSSGL
jgi:hypothetical protein